MEQERRAIRARRRRRETEDTNISGVRDSDHLLYEYARTHTHTRARAEKREEKKGDMSKKLFDPRRDASSCCAPLSISNEGCG